jgi:hypothetical protein
MLLFPDSLGTAGRFSLVSSVVSCQLRSATNLTAGRVVVIGGASAACAGGTSVDVMLIPSSSAQEASVEPDAECAIGWFAGRLGGGPIVLDVADSWTSFWTIFRSQSRCSFSCTSCSMRMSFWIICSGERSNSSGEPQRQDQAP